MVQRIQLVQTPTTTQLQQGFGCPIVSLTNEIFIVKPINIIRPVSIVHLCSGLCKIRKCRKVQNFEREQVELYEEQVVFELNTSNNLYCINIFCTGNYV